MLTTHIASLSLQGKRPSQQDRILVTPGEDASGRFIAAVADGLGGMKSGDKAAEIAVDTLQREAPRALLQMSHGFCDARESLLKLYDLANSRIRDYADAHGQQGLVGTTLVTLIASDSRYLVVNSGDSRCYVINDQGVRQITRDHTVADALLQQGVIAACDYESSPLRNQLTKSLGPKPETDPDVFPGFEFGSIDRECTFLLCSDGFYSTLTDEDMLKLYRVDGNLDDVINDLATEALRRQTSDNLSAVAVRFG
jgi:protein phosphatase